MTKPTSYREPVELPVGLEDTTGRLMRDAEVRAVTGGDELFIGMSPEYNKHANDLVYKTLLLSRTVTRIGDKTMITLTDIRKLHAKDVRALEQAVYRLTYGADAVPEQGDGPSG
jgi:hypothetical protein